MNDSTNERAGQTAPDPASSPQTANPKAFSPQNYVADPATEAQPQTTQRADPATSAEPQSIRFSHDHQDGQPIRYVKSKDPN
jgi:hypothetical protein